VPHFADALLRGPYHLLASDDDGSIVGGRSQPPGLDGGIEDVAEIELVMMIS
jgi:hypothetical protein